MSGPADVAEAQNPWEVRMVLALGAFAGAFLGWLMGPFAIVYFGAWTVACIVLGFRWIDRTYATTREGGADG